VGAGDAFSAAFILTYIGTGDVEKALAAGNYLGGYVASKKGAVPLSDDYPRNLVVSSNTLMPRT
ncbi:MAG: PfkB family carbohydrate kinase, partial [Planctomycetes bacterium]|nr:PfkB family carbohydrate kinase [Planctomycetota bacterium]